MFTIFYDKKEYGIENTESQSPCPICAFDGINCPRIDSDEQTRLCVFLDIFLKKGKSHYFVPL